MTVGDGTTLNEEHLAAEHRTDQTFSRRGLLKQAGVAAGALSVGMRELLANVAPPLTASTPGKTPISPIIDVEKRNAQALAEAQ